MTFEEAWEIMARKNAAITATRVSVASVDLKRMCKAFYNAGKDEGKSAADISFLQSMMGMKK